MIMNKVCVELTPDELLKAPKCEARIHPKVVEDRRKYRGANYRKGDDPCKCGQKARYRMQGVLYCGVHVQKAALEFLLTEACKV